MLTLDLKGDTEVIARLDAMPLELQALLLAKTQDLARQIHDAVVNGKLAGEVLHIRSGALARSIQQDVEASDFTVAGRVYSDGSVPYAAIHEYGGQTRAHDILPTQAKALAFLIGGQQVFAKVVHHPGSTIPERSYLRSTLAEWKSAILQAYQEASSQATKPR